MIAGGLEFEFHHILYSQIDIISCIFKKNLSYYKTSFNLVFIPDYRISNYPLPEQSSKTMVKKVIGLNHIFLHVPNIHQFEVFWRISNNVHYCFIVMQIAIDFDVVKRHFYLFQMFNCKWFQWQLRIESQFFCFSKMFWNSSSLQRHSCEWFRVIY